MQPPDAAELQSIRQLQRIAGLEESATAIDIREAVDVAHGTRSVDVAAAFCDAMESVGGLGGLRAIFDGGGAQELLQLMAAFHGSSEVVTPACKTISFLCNGPAERRSALAAAGAETLLQRAFEAGVAGKDAFGKDWAALALKKLRS